jgi:hypothetical protein
MTSAARASTVGGTVSPSNWAVWEIDSQFVLVWRLHWQIRRVLALEKAIDVTGRPAVLVDEIRPIVDDTTGGDEDA